MEQKPCIQIENLSKRFGSVLANDRVTLDVRHGEILALLGENGSGKSTLVNMLSGIYAPDAGTMSINGIPVHFKSPKDAINSGIGMVHQHFKLIDVFTAAQNIAAGFEKHFFIRRGALVESIQSTAEKFGLAIEPEKKIYEMSVGEKQTVEIIKMLYCGARILILDEPTAVLTPQEITGLFSILRKMKEAGCTIIIITHKLNEVMEISDRVAVLRKGTCIKTLETKSTNPRQLTELMVGASISLEIDRPDAILSKEPFLTVQNLTVTDSSMRRTLDNVTFDIYGGEIFGVAGIAGSGQKELCESITGLTKSTGTITFLNEVISGMTPRNIMKRGIRLNFIPEDRLGMGLAAGMDITSNVMLKTYTKKRRIFIDSRQGKKDAENIVRNYDVSTPSVNHVIRNLSGGNIQKVLLGREIESCPKLLVTAYPVRGLDIGASYRIYDILNNQKKKGTAILFIGEDLDILRSLCDRIMVLHNGSLMAIVDPRKTSKEDIGLLMIGATVGEK